MQDSGKYVGPRYCRAEMYAGCVTWCPLVRHSEYADGMDGRMPDYYITLSVNQPVIFIVA